jgi:hypothetical protein
MRSSGSRVWFWVIGLVGAYRQLTKAQSDIHKQVFLWFNEKSGDMEFWVDLRCYFGDRIMMHKFSRISNFVVFCVLQEVSKHDDHIRPKERNLKRVAPRQRNGPGSRPSGPNVRSNVHR